MSSQHTQRSSTALVPVVKPVLIVARPHPISTEAVWAKLPHGFCLAEILGPDAVNCRVEIAGSVIPEFWWRHVRPKPGTVVHVTRFPQNAGGSGWKMVMRLVAFAALAVVTYGIAEGVTWLPEAIQGLTQGWAAATAALVGVGGSLLINALIPPAATGVGQSTSPTQLQGISGVQNSVDPYGAITCVFGTMLVFPKLAAQSYSELDENDQYLRALFDLGWGQLSTSEIQIGTDPLSIFTDVEFEIGPSPDLFPTDVDENAAGAELDDDGLSAIHTSGANADQGSVDLIFGSGLFGVDSSGAPVTVTCKIKIEMQATDVFDGPGSGVWTIPLTNPGSYYGPISATVAISGDGAGATASVQCGIIGSNGPYGFFYGVQRIVILDNGTGYTAATAVLTVSTGAGAITPATIGTPVLGAPNSDWSNVMSADGLTISNSEASSDGTYLVCASSAQEIFRVGVQWNYPYRNGYQIRVTRYLTDWGASEADDESGDLTWTVLRTIRNVLPSTTPTTKIALRIKATDQLNGTVSQFNLLVSQIIPAWTGTEWAAVQTSNPAWVYRWLLRDCPANPRRVDPTRIDDATLIEWGADCDANGLTFDYTNDDVTTVFELLKIICACGRASFTVLDGKFSVVRDVSQDVPVQIFTPRNTLSFQGTRTFTDLVHGLRVQFINPQAGYQQDELVVYDDGYDDTNATQFEQLQIPGCNSAPMAWKLGRYNLAAARLRPNTYTWTTDVEHLICNRGDLILFASDIISAGIGWGRVKTITLDGDGNVKAVTVDEPQTVTELGPTYAMRFRCRDGSTKMSVVTFEPDTLVRVFTLVVPAPGINPGDLFLFGVSGQDSIPMLVSKIEPASDLAATITAIDSAPAVLTADAGYIDSTATYHAGLPPLISSITGAAWNYDIPAPTFTTVPSLISGMSGPLPLITGHY